MAALSEIADGGAAFWTCGDGPKTFRLIILRSGEQAFGYVNRCAHFGVPLAEKIEQLIFKPHQSLSCNVHYARYTWQEGYCEFGDCEGENLLRVPLEVSAGVVRIATT